MKKHIKFNFCLLLSLTCLITYLYQQDVNKVKKTFQQNISNKKTINDLSEKDCLKEALYFEARNTTKKEKFVIAEVLLNRVKHKKYPKTICEVVFQPYQFSYRNKHLGKNYLILPKKSDIYSKVDQKALVEIENIVDSIFMQNKNKFIPDNVLFYHTRTLNKKPKWTASSSKIKIDIDKNFKHVYYAYFDKQ